MNKNLLQKLESFIKIAVEQCVELERAHEKLSKYEKIKEAQLAKVSELDKSLAKAAKALYDSDYIVDKEEKEEFLKRAKEEQSYLPNLIEKLCNAADVSLIGKPARVANSKQAEYDPVMAKAFGTSYRNEYLLMDE